jgi:phage tail sheath gpL-like
MGVLILNITTGRDDDTLSSTFETAGGKHSIAQRILNYISSVQSGCEKASGSTAPSIAISVQGNAVQATAVASGATGNQFNVGEDDEETAENLASTINASASALVSDFVTAEASGTDVLVTSVFYGVAGNSTTLESSDATITISGARLTGGAADSSAQTLSF